MIKALPAPVYSPDHLRFCAEELTRYASEVGRALRSKRPIPEEPASAESRALLELLPASSKKPLQQQLQELVADLESLQQTAPVVHLTLVAPAPYRLKQELVGWVRANLSPVALVAFSANPDIAGGVVVRAGDRVFDESFRTKLSHSSARLTELLTNV